MTDYIVTNYIVTDEATWLQPFGVPHVETLYRAILERKMVAQHPARYARIALGAWPTVLAIDALTVSEPSGPLFNGGTR